MYFIVNVFTGAGDDSGEPLCGGGFEAGAASVQRSNVAVHPRFAE